MATFSKVISSFVEDGVCSYDDKEIKNQQKNPTGTMSIF